MSQKPQTPLTVAANIDRNTFVKFAMFDNFRLRKRWKRPLAFAGIFLFFALICFLGRETHEQAMLMTLVLAAVALVLPCVWLVMYLYSVNQQVKVNRLASDHAQYFVTLDEKHVSVLKGEEKAEYPWKKIPMAYRNKACIYLYVTPERAYLLPDNGTLEEAWAIVTEHMDASRTKVL